MTSFDQPPETAQGEAEYPEPDPVLAGHDEEASLVDVEPIDTAEAEPLDEASDRAADDHETGENLSGDIQAEDKQMDQDVPKPAAETLTGEVHDDHLQPEDRNQDIEVKDPGHENPQEIGATGKTGDLSTNSGEIEQAGALRPVSNVELAPAGTVALGVKSEDVELRPETGRPVSDVELSSIGTAALGSDKPSSDTELTPDDNEAEEPNEDEPPQKAEVEEVHEEHQSGPARQLEEIKDIPSDSEAEPGTNRYATWSPQRIDAMKRLFQEGVGMEDTHGTRNGPLGNDFTRINTDLDTLLKAVREDLDLGVLMPNDYTSPEARAKWESLDLWQKSQVGAIKDLRRDALNGIAEKITYPAIRHQTIEEGVLAVPAYQQQGGLKGEDGRVRSQTCVTSCFRMVFGDIVGWTPTEDETIFAMNRALDTNTITHPDEDFLNLFKSAAFREVTGQKVDVYSYIGADLNSLGTRAAKITQLIPGAKVYAMASLGTESAADSNVWHMNLINSADRRFVYVHDPSPSFGQPNRQLYKRPFAQRWAKASNRCHLVVARPDI